MFVGHNSTHTTHKTLYLCNKKQMADSSVNFKKFEKEFRSFIKLLDEILTTNEKNKGIDLTGGSVGPSHKALNRYKRAFDLSAKQGNYGIHCEYFKEIYSNYKKSILKGPDSDKWLKSSSNQIVIQFGKGNKKISADINIAMSQIYRTACELRDHAEKSLKGLDDAAYESCKELNYPDGYKLYMYRIFHLLADDSSEKEKLATCVKELEDTLGIVNQNPTPQNEGGFSGIMSHASKIFSGMGYNIPPEQMPTEKDFSQILGDVMSKPQTLQVISSIFKDVEKYDNPDQLISKLSSSGPMMQNIMGAISQTATGAAAAAASDSSGSTSGDPKSTDDDSDGNVKMSSSPAPESRDKSSPKK